MGAEFCVIDCYSGDNWEFAFTRAWFSDDKAVQDTCTAKATIYTTLLIGGFLSKIIKDYE